MDIHIIDDDRTTLLLYSKIAENCGFKPTSFNNAEDYLNFIGRNEYQPPLGIFTDIEMPGINGYQLMCDVRKTYPNQRFVVTSGAPEVKSGEALACFYFSKPVSIEDFQSALLALSKCAQCELRPRCINGKACISDDRTLFNIDDWECPLNTH